MTLSGIGEMSRERFAEVFIEIGAGEGALEDPVFDPARFLVIDGDRIHELAPLYERYLVLPARSRRYFLARVLRGSSAESEPELPAYANVRARILPRLRSAAYLDATRLDDHNRGRTPRALHEPLAGDLHVAWVIDGDETMTPVSRAILESWGLACEEVAREALENLAGRGGELEMLSPGLWLGPWGDAYAASRLLLAEMLAVCAEPIVAAPDRDTLLVADRRNDDALRAMVSFIEGVAHGGHALSRELFRLHEGVLHPFALPTTHPSATIHRRLCVAERVQRYGEQQWLLQEAVGDAYYVATAELDEQRDGSVTSRALWTEGVNALLPHVDRVHLLSAQADGTSSRLVVADLADILDLDGVLERTEELLPRYRTLRFPTDGELGAIAVPVARHAGTAAISEPSISSCRQPRTSLHGSDLHTRDAGGERT